MCIHLTKGGDASTTYTYIIIKLNYLTQYTKNPLVLPMRNSLNIFASIACNSTIASNQQRQEHNNFATMQRKKSRKPRSSPRGPCLLKHRSHTQTLTRIDKATVKDYDYMTTMDVIMRQMKLTRLLPIVFSEPQDPLVYIYLYFNTLKSLIKMYTLEKSHTSPLCTLMPQIITLLTLAYEGSTTALGMCANKTTFVERPPIT